MSDYTLAWLEPEFTFYTDRVAITLGTKENHMSTLTINAQTKANRKVAEEEAKYAQQGRKAIITVEAITYAEPAFASLSGYNDNGRDNDQSFYFKLDADDLEALQNAIYEARVKLHKASQASKIKNPTLSSVSFASSTF